MAPALENLASLVPGPAYTTRGPTKKPQLAPQTRPLSLNELSYYLPSREFGLNDAFLNTTFLAPRGLVTPYRVRLAWAILLVRHPLMASRVEMKPGEYDNARFVYTPPSDPEAAIEATKRSTKFAANTSPEQVQDEYLNGPRLCSSEVPVFLYISTAGPDPLLLSNTRRDTADKKAPTQEYSVLMGIAHVAMDGLGTHMACAEFFELLGGGGARPRRNAELLDILKQELAARFGGVEALQVLPPSVETRAPAFDSALARADFLKDQQQFIGGQAIPRKSSKSRRCDNHDVLFTTSETTTILARCKKEDVTIQNALFAACNLSWMRIVHEPSARGEKLRASMRAIPALRGRLDWSALMYTAVGMRGILPPLTGPAADIPASYAVLSVGYFNVMLPTHDYPSTSDASDASSSTGATQSGSERALHAARSRWFWDQARNAKKQGESAMQHPNFLARTVEHGKERFVRAKAFAKQDDARLGIISNSSPSPSSSTDNRPQKSSNPKPKPTSNSSPSKEPPPPSTALIGLSLIGNLDKLYAAHKYPALQILRSSSGTRKGPGALLIFLHTLAGRLYVHVGWDAEGFEPGLVEDFSEGLVRCIQEFALQDGGDATGMVGVRAKL